MQEKFNYYGDVVVTVRQRWRVSADAISNTTEIYDRLMGGSGDFEVMDDEILELISVDSIGENKE